VGLVVYFDSLKHFYLMHNKMSEWISYLILKWHMRHSAQELVDSCGILCIDMGDVKNHSFSKVGRSIVILGAGFEDKQGI
jgi:hypothetical protein